MEEANNRCTNAKFFGCSRFNTDFTDIETFGRIDFFLITDNKYINEINRVFMFKMFIYNNKYWFFSLIIIKLIKRRGILTCIQSRKYIDREKKHCRTKSFYRFICLHKWYIYYLLTRFQTFCMFQKCFSITMWTLLSSFDVVHWF